MVKFVDISDGDFQAWKERAIGEYFADRVKAGNDSPDSPNNSREEFESLLPYGRLTSNNYICHIVDEKDGDRKVGIIWYAVGSRAFPSNTLYLYDIEIDEAIRGKGYGTAALKLLEEKTKTLGKKRIVLHVFAHNTRARRLYEELGYKPTNIVMAKDL
jgi:RimJ/RimL family protein N-acetyltransferase